MKTGALWDFNLNSTPPASTIFGPLFSIAWRVVFSCVTSAYPLRLKCMPLFDDIVRAELRPRRENESAFEYMNISARPGLVAVRELLEGWFPEIPDPHAADIRARFRSRTAVDHQGAFWELYLHRLLRCMNYEVQIHPDLPRGVTSHPDFLGRGQAGRVFYVEATQATPPRTDVAAERRINELYDSLNRMHSPNFFLEVQCRGSTETNIPGRPLRETLEQWLVSLDVADIERNYRNRTYENLPRFEWTFDGLHLTFTAIPKSPAMRGTEGVRPIAVQMPMGFRQILVHEDIRAAIEGKAQKYDELAHPLIVAVNVDEDFCESDDITNALFGDECAADYLLPDGTWRHEPRVRLPNGAFYGRRGPRNRTVSAVIVTRRMSPTMLRMCGLHVVHNPYATIPLAHDWLELPQMTARMPEGVLEAIAGRSAADVLGVPEPWPIPD
jgi:hypothetical protein